MAYLAGIDLGTSGTKTVLFDESGSVGDNAAVAVAHTSKISIDPKGRVLTFCCAVPGAWHVMGCSAGCRSFAQKVPGQFLRRRNCRGRKQMIFLR
jgi:sugar (pentulose or hexulose) kinase